MNDEIHNDLCIEFMQELKEINKQESRLSASYVDIKTLTDSHKYKDIYDIIANNIIHIITTRKIVINSYNIYRLANILRNEHDIHKFFSYMVNLFFSIRNNK